MSNEPSFLRLSRRALRRRPSPIRELLPLMALPDMISLGGGYPNPSTFPFHTLTAELWPGQEPLTLDPAAMQRATQYGPTEGLPGLLQELRRWHLHKDGVDLADQGLLVLDGSQEGLYLVADVLLDEGDCVALSEPSYPGAVAAFRSFTEKFLATPLDGDGLRVDLLAEALQARQAQGAPLPRFIYTIPNGHNPAGVTLSEPRRHALVEVARRFDLLILEDDPYQLVSMDDAPRLPSLQSLAPERVLRLDSFSKILCPGLRIGYASGPPALVRAMVLHKQASNLQVSSMNQVLLEHFLAQLGPEGLLQRIADNQRLYRAQRDTLLAAAREHLPPGVRWQVPRAGLFVWFELPAGCDAARMLERDLREIKVLLVPGAAFSTQGGCQNALRASFSMVPAERLVEGMRRFGEMLRRELARV